MFEFFKKLLPNYEKRKLLEQLDIAEKKVTGILVESILCKQQYLASNDVGETKSKMGLRFEKDARKYLKDFHREHLVNHATILMEVTNRLLPKITYIRKYIDKNFDNTVAKDALSYQEASVLRLAGLITFYSTYTQHLLQLILDEECSAAGADIKSALVKPIVEDIVRNYDQYLQLCVIWSKKDTEFDSIVKATSHMTVAETSELGNSASGTNTDPFRSNFMPMVGDAILFFREWRIKTQNEAYERDKMIKQSLEMRLLYLKEKQANNGQGDERLKRTIESIEARIVKLEKEIKDYEEDALGTEDKGY